MNWLLNVIICVLIVAAMIVFIGRGIFRQVGGEPAVAAAALALVVLPVFYRWVHTRFNRTPAHMKS